MFPEQHHILTNFIQLQGAKHTLARDFLDRGKGLAWLSGRKTKRALLRLVVFPVYHLYPDQPWRFHGVPLTTWPQHLAQQVLVVAQPGGLAQAQNEARNIQNPH